MNRAIIDNYGKELNMSTTSTNYDVPYPKLWKWEFGVAKPKLNYSTVN